MSTTDSSDWEAAGSSGLGTRSRSEPPLPGPEPPLVPMLTGAVAAVRRSHSPPIVHVNRGGLMRTLASDGLFGGRGFAARPPPVGNAATSRGPIAYPVPFPPPPPPRRAQHSQEQAASTDLTFQQLVERQDVDATPSQLAFMARVNGRGSIRGGRGSRGLGGRGSRGGRPPKIKIEPPHEDGDPTTGAPAPGDPSTDAPAPSVPASGAPAPGLPAPGLQYPGFAATVIPAPDVPRKVNKGGRPRGSRAGQSSSSSTRSVNRGGRPRGSRAGMSAATMGRGGLGRGGGSAGLKRKRKSGGGEDGEEDDEDAMTDSSEEITSLPTQSRSGRRITQVVTPVPLGVFEPESSSSKPPKPPSAFAHPADLPLSQKPAKRKRVTLSAVCKNCGRGHSPQSNQIVFCDGCNTPWHQYCHDRPITPTVIQEEEKEWHCGDCEVHAEEASYMIGRIPPAEGMGLAEKRRALEGMERAELVALLLRASSLYPDLPILKPPPPPETWTAALATATRQAPVVRAEAEYEYYDEPLPYPRAGNGVRLPPEEDDEGLLVDEDVKTYSHSWVRGENWVGGLAEAADHSTGLVPANFAIEVGA